MFHPLLLAVSLALQVQSQFPVTQAPAKPAANKVLAKVNGVAIKAGDVERFLWDWRSYEVLEELIQYRMIIDEAARVGVKVTEADIQKRMSAQMKAYQSQLPEGANLMAELKKQGFTKSRIYINTKREMLLDALAAKEFSPALFVKVSTIVVVPETQKASDIAAAIEKANGAYDRLKKGENWDAVLKSVVTDQQLTANNGFLGWRQIKVFPEPVQQELKKLKPGEYTQPAQTSYGIQIFRIDALGSGLAGSELEELRGQFLRATRQTILSRIREVTKIERK